MKGLLLGILCVLFVNSLFASTVCDSSARELGNNISKSIIDFNIGDLDEDENKIVKIDKEIGAKLLKSENKYEVFELSIYAYGHLNVSLDGPVVNKSFQVKYFYAGGDCELMAISDMGTVKRFNKLQEELNLYETKLNSLIKILE